MGGERLSLNPDPVRIWPCHRRRLDPQRKLRPWRIANCNYPKSKRFNQRAKPPPGTGTDATSTPSYLALAIFDNLALASFGLLALISKPHVAPLC